MKWKLGLGALFAGVIATPLCLLAVVVVAISAPQASACVYSDQQALPANVVINGVTDLKGGQIANARLIIGIASSRGLSVRDAKVALMVALQESNLYNLTYGDADSLGLFQQRPSQGWGTPEQIMNPIYATNKFYDALVTIMGRDAMPLIEVAIAAQHPSRSAYEATFMSYEPTADELLAGMVVNSNSTTTSSTTTSTSTTPTSTDAGGLTSTTAAAGFETACSSTNTGVPGKVIIAPGANNPGQPITPETLAFLAEVAGIYGKALICTTGTNHSYLTVNGNVSDHTSGHACDIGMAANGGTDDGPVGDAIMTACLIAAGDSPIMAHENAIQGGLYTLEHGGLRIQCIWKTDEGGNHHNHVHIGANPVSSG